jgi:hypothetical protein
MTAIDHKTACAIRDQFPKAYFGNSNQYGDLMGYHVGDAGMICIQVPKAAVPEWRDLECDELEAKVNESIRSLALPIKAYNPEYIGGEYQLYFVIE